MARTSPKEQGSDARERILVAGLAAFSEHGFDGTKTRDVALGADVPLGLVQYHFGGKQKLWQAAVDRAFSAMRDGLQAIIDDPDPEDDGERLRRMIRNHVRFAAHNPEFIRLMHEEGKRRGPRMRWLVDRHVQPLYDLFIGHIERSQKGGYLPADVAPVHLVYIFIGAAGVIFHQAEECKRVSGVDPSDESVIEAHARALERIIMGPPD